MRQRINVNRILLRFINMWRKKIGTANNCLKDMVKRQIQARGVKNEAVLNAMMKVDRALFLPDSLKYCAYMDDPLPIGEGQTISQPYIVGLMTEMLDPQTGDRVLEVGTGSGYQTAILAELVKHVYSLEIIPALAKRARALLIDEMKYKNLSIRVASGYAGWAEEAPFDKIIVTAAPPVVPDALTEQLASGGRMVVPVGDCTQRLCLIQKDNFGLRRRDSILVRFVPMVDY